MAQERLQKILARGGIASRRAAEEIILAGRVRVNGLVVTELGSKADPRNDKVELDGKRVVAEDAIYVIMNKPRGVVSTMSDPEGRPTVAPILASFGARLFPVGRLDFATSGALLATNDGEFSEGLLHPKRAVPKTYVVKVHGIMEKDQLDMWRNGVKLDDGPTLPAEANFLRHEGDKTWFELTIKEGRNQQIRRMGEATGFLVMRLSRVSFAGITTETLAPGDVRLLNREELFTLKKAYGVPRKLPSNEGVERAKETAAMTKRKPAVARPRATSGDDRPVRADKREGGFGPRDDAEGGFSSPAARTFERDPSRPKWERGPSRGPARPAEDRPRPDDQDRPSDEARGEARAPARPGARITGARGARPEGRAPWRPEAREGARPEARPEARSERPGSRPEGRPDRAGPSAPRTEERDTRPRAPTRGGRSSSRDERIPGLEDRAPSRGGRGPSSDDRAPAKPKGRSERSPFYEGRAPARPERGAPRGDRGAPRPAGRSDRGPRPEGRPDRGAPRGDRPAPRGDRAPSRPEGRSDRGARPEGRPDRAPPRGEKPAPFRNVRNDRSAPEGPRGPRPEGRPDRGAPRGDRGAPRPAGRSDRGPRPEGRPDRAPPRGDRGPSRPEGRPDRAPPRGDRGPSRPEGRPDRAPPRGDRGPSRPEGRPDRAPPRGDRGPSRPDARPDRGPPRGRSGPPRRR